MKYLAITMFVLCVHVSMAIYNATGIFSIALQENQDFINTFSKSELKDESYVQSQVDSNQDPGLGDYIKAISLFIGSFFLGVIVVPYTLHLLGLNWFYASLFSVPVYFMYVAAWIQLVSKDNWVGKI